MNPLRMMVIGVGHLGRIHARIATGLDEIELVAVVDARREAREEVASSTGARPLENYQSLVDQVDAAILATPTNTHHAIGMDLLSRGVPVFIEKPLAATCDEADELFAAAQEREVVLQVGHVERFNPALASVADELSDPKYVEAVRTSGYPFRSTDIGVVMDVMIHDIDVVLSLVRAPVVRVEALGISVLGGHEDMASARIVFEGGCVAQLTASRASYVQQRIMRVFTPSLFASIDFGARKSIVVRPTEPILQRRFDVEGLDSDEREYWKAHLFEELLASTELDARDVNAIEEEQRDFVGAIRSGRLPQVDGEAGRNAVAVADQILQSIAEHAWDGDAAGRRGPLAMPELPILKGPPVWPTQDKRRRAG